MTKKIDQKWIECPSLMELRKLAREYQVSLGSKSKWELFAELADIMSEDDLKKHPGFDSVLLWKREFTQREIAEKERKHEEVPKSIIFHKDYEEPLMNWMDEHEELIPTCFSGYVFGNPDQDLQFTFTKDVVCVCGEKFSMEKKCREKHQSPKGKAWWGPWEVHDLSHKDCPNLECTKTWRWLK
jgi:hypothetical protein